MAVLLIVFSEFIKGIIFRKNKYEKIRYDIEINDINVKLDTFLKSILDKEHMMEIKLYDSIDYINRQRMGLYGEVKKKFISLLKKDILLSLFMFLIEKACYYGVFIYYAYITILEYITLGSFVYVVDMIEKISSSVSGVFSSFAAFSESRIYFDEMDTV